MQITIRVITICIVIEQALCNVLQTPMDKWINTVNMTYAREGHTTSLLTNGKVLVTGGQSNNGMLNSAELYDPSRGNWTTTGNMSNARRYHTASTLTDGRVLIAGGNNSTVTLNIAEIYDPSTGNWTTTGNLNNARMMHTASVLTDGKVLITGGEKFGAQY
ncbi:unnamed protein product [Adineta steineri]|uniref:Uncharacterized protein n=2 Tax=Adineta steineri TaxID=433720 RepID=A0A813N6X9_9BILA|nr:unnamed protein product [Adineta steineri]CAF0817388.1 unnamed protein product [Adineta steineri]